LTGTGLLTLGAMELPQSGNESFALDRVDDQIDVTTRTFLGLTMSCARGHNHKTDPITQRDYYALAGIFYSSRTLSGGQRGAYVDPDLLLRLPTMAQARAATAKPPASAAGKRAGGAQTSLMVADESSAGMDAKGL